ncbi:MAG: NADH-quinone oxidoreductase subunit C [Eggerthellaceae bacterium]|nr:NADH-quinone oxidoreductase subunit C [Eggerthellaceae bacterium]
MADSKTFQELSLDKLVSTAEQLSRDDWRSVQMLCTSTESGIDMTYTFAKDDTLANYQIRGVTSEDTVPSIQHLFLGLFPFENEAADLFGVNIEGMVLDFAGRFYDISEKDPMTILTPEAKERMDKEAKKAAAAAAKAAKDASKAEGEGADAPAEKPEVDLEAKLAGMDPEKAAKVRAAMEAKKKKEAEKGGDA